MKHCELLQKDIFAYMERELPPDRIQHLDQHTSECAECNRILAEFRRVMELMEDQKSIEPRPFAETRLMQGIESRLENRPKTAIAVFGRILQPALLAAGVTVSVATGFFIGSGFAGTHTKYNQNDEMNEAVRADLNVPEFMTDEIFYFSE